MKKTPEQLAIKRLEKQNRALLARIRDLELNTKHYKYQMWADKRFDQYLK